MSGAAFEVEVVNGNLAAALAAKLSRPDVIAAYPITPQSPAVEYLTQFRADGQLNCDYARDKSGDEEMSEPFRSPARPRRFTRACVRLVFLEVSHNLLFLAGVCC